MTSTKKENEENFFTIIICTAITCTAISLLACYKYYNSKIEQRCSKLVEERLSERKGRIRAELKLRSYAKQQQLLQSLPTNKEEHKEFNLKCIGKIKSPFLKRMGTPRQGIVVPHSRAFLILDSTIPSACIDGILEYSHVWIIFEFHANTDIPKSNNINDGKKNATPKSKIKPPRAGGKKVGMLATRSPHRPNPIGLSLVKLESIVELKEGLALSLTGVDLVNGTPVYDIKPFVPWDTIDEPLIAPSWVTQQDEIPIVTILPSAERQLREFLLEFQPFYNELDEVLSTLKEILSQDPRASHVRNSTQSEEYQILFCQVEVTFRVLKNEKTVQVLGTKLKEIDQVMDGIPIMCQDLM